MAKIQNSYRILGHVVERATRKRAVGIRVETWDKDLIFDELVGSAMTDADGRFEIEFTKSYFSEIFVDRSPDLFFKVFAGDTLVKSTRDSILWNLKKGNTPVEIAISTPQGLVVPGNDGDYEVNGTVASPDSAGVGGLRVKIVDKNVGNDVALAATTTDVRGKYHVTIAAAAVRALGKECPDLQALVYSGETLLAGSEVRYNASTGETLNVALPANSKSLPSEYETLTATLATHYPGELGKLEESDTRQDITYLANKTGWDARAVALAALADQLSARTRNGKDKPEIEPDYFYALFRAGLPSDEHTLFQTDAGTLKAVWNKAIEQGVMPKERAGGIAKVTEGFQARGAQSLLTGPAVVGASSMKEMLSASRLSGSQQERFAELYTAHRTDMEAFWDAASKDFGPQTANRLQVDGKLAALTINNAPLMTVLRTAAGDDELTDPRQLAQAGFHRAARWEALLTENVPVPREVAGDNPEAKRKNYAQYLAAQIRLSYPTTAVAEMVGSGDLEIDAAGPVREFLTEHQDRFEIGAQPVEQYIRQEDIELAPETVTQIKRLQRVYQITPGDVPMAGLLKAGIDSACKVIQHDKEAFVRTFGEELGGVENAAIIHDRSVQVHNAVLNIAVSYLTARNGIPLGAQPLQAAELGSDPTAQVLQPAPKGTVSITNATATAPQAVARSAAKSLATSASAAVAAHTEDVIAYSTLETLFGEMDFCSCDHCRSVLSPAAYLVDLLLFIDHPTAAKNPQEVLFERRPDLQHLPLTCENTNIALPYIDLVNETLEYFIANSSSALSLNGYIGHDTDGMASADLLASPQFVIDSAYTTLRNERFPSPLPFHQPLESLRRHFEKFGVPLPLAMERLRQSNALERGTATYGWRDILMEELQLSRAEHELLTDSSSVSLSGMYGFPATAANVISTLSNAKNFTRRVGITYEDIVAILRTRFINPNAGLIPKLERLGVPFATLKGLKDGTITGLAFAALLPTGTRAPDPAEYGGNIGAWVTNPVNYARIMGLITLFDPSSDPDPCNFDKLEFRYSDTSTGLGPVEFVRLLRFIRLWKKLGWTIEQTDAAICALYRGDMAPLAASDIDTLVKLDAGLLTLLPRLGLVVRIMRALNLSPKRDLLPLLACFSDIGTYGDSALYQQMFLNPALLKQDPVYADNGYGEFLVNSAVNLADHAESLRSAFNLTRDEYDRIVKALEYDGTTPLTVSNVSAIFRRGYLARKLKLSVRELLLLIQLTGLDPFAAPDPTDPAIMLILTLVQDLKERSLKSAAAFHLIWNQDLSGKSAPDPAQVTELARTLRADFTKIEAEFSVGEDPNGEIERAHMTLVYGQEVTDAFFALLDGTIVLDTAYSHSGAGLHGAMTAADPAIAYDDFNQRLSHTGLVTPGLRSALHAVPLTAFPPFPNLAQRARFNQAVERLFDKSNDTLGSFFNRYPELQPIYDNVLLLGGTLVFQVSYTHPAATLEAAIVAADSRLSYDNVNHKLSYSGYLMSRRRDALKNTPQVTPEFKAAVEGLFAASQQARNAVLAQLRPELSRRRKRQQALQQFAAAAKADVSFAQAILDSTALPYPLHAAMDISKPAMDDVLALETPGLAAQIFYHNTATGTPDLTTSAVANLEYSASNNPLPASTPGAIMSGIWTGQIEVPEAGFYNFVVETDPGAKVKLSLDGGPPLIGLPLSGIQNGNVFRNATPRELEAGTLHEITLTVENAKDGLSLKWETPKRAREIIPPRYLYPPAIFAPFSDAHTRFLKAVALAADLGLNAREMAHFATHKDYRIDAQGNQNNAGQGWLNSLPVADNLLHTTHAADVLAATLNATLLTPLRDLLAYSRIKAEVSPGEESLLKIFQDPISATANADSLLFAITRWDKASLIEIFNHFGGTVTGLAAVPLFRRVYDAMALVRKMGISAQALIDATTNEPDGIDVRNLQAALRARYDAASWRDVIQPINDRMRSLQRDALVAYILHQMRSNPSTEHIDTADKLFEYFLMDVQMEPCMLTSRIRHALSSVQLFIERCFMNLEPRVSPASFNTKQWEWMKRYRVWEANRKVFLFPENWLEPELRDDKSPIFKEIESELLQSDITEETAATALLNYLSKLEEVAKLEPCGIHHVEADPARTGDIEHVVARSAGGHRKYFYRRKEFGYWTPWEQIKLDIEDNPVVPVVWHDRLLLFWLRIMKQGATDESPTPPASPTAAANRTVAQLAAETKQSQNTKMVVQAVLCWSEYYNGKWQPARTSEVDRPTQLGKFPVAGPGAFERSALHLSFLEEGDALRVNISGNGAGTFLLYNTHSLPMHDVPLAFGSMPFGGISLRYNDREWVRGVNNLTARYLTGLRIAGFHFGSSLTRRVLKPKTQFNLIEPHHQLNNAWDAPFFFEDWRHVFFVTTSELAVRIQDVFTYGRTVNPGGGQDPAIESPGFPWSPAFLTENANIQQATTGVRFGDRLIGPAGSTAIQAPPSQ